MLQDLQQTSVSTRFVKSKMSFL
uniref:Uncharacterized protein n=1 Tax=Anguilla anguilla TaxID=7936 RepID=A0A0E9VHV7_ANGAN